MQVRLKERLNLQPATFQLATMTMTVRTLLNEATSQLAGISESARLEAQLLLGELLGWSRAALLAHPEEPVPPAVAERFHALVARRATGEPVAYILGRRDFYGREFLVDRRVLIPRPETELLVERAVELLRPRPAPRAADIGTGSGAIAVTLAAELPHVEVIATDIAADALAVAAANARRHGVADRVRLRLGPWLEPLEEPLDLIAANLPYVGTDEAGMLSRDVRDFEPHIALFAGREGLDSIKILLDQVVEAQRARALLRPGGAILLEIGYAHGERLAELARERFPGSTVTVTKDLAGLDRLVEIQVAKVAK